MKNILALVILLLLSTVGFSQKPDDVLATAGGKTWRIRDLSADAKGAAAKFPDLLPQARKQLLSQFAGEMLIEAEAKARAITPQQLLRLETRKIKDPSAADIQGVYDANRDQLGGKTLADVREQIVEFLRRDPEQAAIKAFVDTLALKYKAAYPKDINAPGSKGTDIVFAMTGRTMTWKEFDDLSRLTLYGIAADFWDDIREETAEAVYNQLVLDEAVALKVDSSELIAREVSSKMKDFTDEERSNLTMEFRKKLFTKYGVRISVPEPPEPVQQVSVDDDPATGPATAPVTIVMFSDFQCPACSATHPILKQAMAAYGDKIRFVVRNFPLEMHPNSFHAALAAHAAAKQNKFFEYIDVLYKNQKAQDDASLKKYAAGLGLNVAQFAIDFNSETTAAEVRKDMADGRSYGISGTPSIFVNGRYIRTLSLEAFKAAIDAALRK